MRARWKLVGSVVLAFAVVVTACSVLFFNGYGPLALADRRSRLSPGAAKVRIDHALRTTMGAVSPSLAFAGAYFEVRRERDRWDGEPSMVSAVTEVVVGRTAVASTRLPALMDQVTQAWQGLGSTVVHRSNPSDEIQSLHGVGEAGGETFLLFLAAAQPDSTYRVKFLVEAYGVLYQPAHEYEPVSPLARTSLAAMGDPVDDPYWSH
ncbi:hypothetical protein [Kitasatospora sp. SC0581]|uniref:hypothetical protein n=1 Tax=Kitasatospora sp. SC0581 TaxID=3394360 RepID=UPI003A855C8F